MKPPAFYLLSTNTFLINLMNGMDEAIFLANVSFKSKDCQLH